MLVKGAPQIFGAPPPFVLTTSSFCLIELSSIELIISRLIDHVATGGVEDEKKQQSTVWDNVPGVRPHLSQMQQESHSPPPGLCRNERGCC